jgi:glutamine cyclotransferase
MQGYPHTRRPGEGRDPAVAPISEASSHHHLAARKPGLWTPVCLSRRLSASILPLLAVLAGCANDSVAAPAAERLTIIAEHPHDPEAYTQGLLFHEGIFYESTGLNGSSSVRKVEIETGRVLEKRNLDNAYFGEGLAILDGRAYQLTWRNRVAFVWDVETLELLGSHPITSDGWGLTTDGSHLILSDGTHLLRFIDPATFEIVRTLQVTYDGRVVNQLNELEWVRGEIWANIYQQDRIARIDPTTGVITGWVSTEGLLSWLERRAGAEVANGIAYDSIGDRLWLTGKLWPKVFQVQRPD